MSIASVALKATLVASLALVVGCFESEYPLGERQPGALDLSYVGDWELESRDDQGQTSLSRLIVRNVHNEAYYVEWSTDDDKPFRATAWLTDVNGTKFVNMMPLADDGKLADSYIIMRVVGDGETRFTLENLNPDFFQDRKVDSSASLRKLIAENVRNAEMYRGEPMIALREP